VLPNYENAIIDVAKLRDYCLNPFHPRGKHKAKVFKSALDLNEKGAEKLEQYIRDALFSSEVLETSIDQHGKRYIVDVVVKKEFANVVIRTAWIIKANESVPRLVTCYVK